MPVFYRLLLLAGFLVVSAEPGSAHKLQQVVVEFEVDAEGWRATSEFEALYVLDDLIRETVPASYDLAWLNSRNDEELYRLMRLVTQSFYEERFRVTVGGVLRPVDFSFPDYASTPPVFTEDENLAPVVRVVMEGRFGPEEGPVVVGWNASEKPHLVLAPQGDGFPERRVLLVKAGDEVELARPEAPAPEQVGDGAHESSPAGVPVWAVLVAVLLAIPLLVGGVLAVVRRSSRKKAG